MRWDVALRTTIDLRVDWRLWDVADESPIAIRFQGQDFVWHPPAESQTGLGRRAPCITVMTESSSDYYAEMLAMERFLSALGYLFDQGIAVANSAGASWPGPFDPPVPWAADRDGIAIQYAAPAEVAVRDDERLRLVLALYREARSSESPFYRFLSCWNALEAAFDLSRKDLAAFINNAPGRAPGWFHGHDAPPGTWASYFRDSNRDAIAHAVRKSPGRPVRDPDEPGDRARLEHDSRLLLRLLRLRVEDRWGTEAVTSIPRDTLS